MKYNSQFNLLTVGILVIYLIYINMSSSLGWNDAFLSMLINLSSNWIFRVVFFALVGAIALNLINGGIGLAVVLTIAFLNTHY